MSPRSSAGSLCCNKSVQHVRGTHIQLASFAKQTCLALPPQRMKAMKAKKSTLGFAPTHNGMRCSQKVLMKAVACKGGRKMAYETVAALQWPSQSYLARQCPAMLWSNLQ